jgi:hypothetical protein
MSDTTQAFLEHHTGRVVEATLIPEMTSDEVTEADADWKPLIDARRRELETQGVPRSNWPQHHHWNWEQKADHYGVQLSYRFFGIECEGETQAMMLVDLDTKRSRVEAQREMPLVYDEYLSAAPWNLHGFVDTPLYKGAGTILVRAAIELSLELEYRGRIGLHSLPQADPFYTRCGMTDLGPDLAYYGLQYFEMTPEQAELYLV